MSKKTQKQGEEFLRRHEWLNKTLHAGIWVYIVVRWKVESAVDYLSKLVKKNDKKND